MEHLLVTIVFPLLGTILTGFIGAFFHKANKKLDLDIEDSVLDNAVLYAEQLGKNYLKKHGNKMPSNEKMDAAVDFILGAIPKKKTDAYLDRLKRKVEAKVYDQFHWKQM